MTELAPSIAFAKYRPIAQLGQGGMAQVFLALASGPAGWSKLVVLKQIREQLAEDPEFLTMFLDEARLAARLNHPNVVQTTEVGGEGSSFYICMEYLEGQPLNRILSRLHRGGDQLTRGMLLRVLIDTLAGLHHAHELCDFDGKPLQVVHRDATPHNVFLTYAGQVKVVDFGIAKAMSSSAETRTGVLKGKIAYMAPEQALGEKVDRRADIFSVGMMLWDVLAGHRPYRGLPDTAILHKIVSEDVPSPRLGDPDVPPTLEAICMKALAHAKEDRYATAAEMAAALEDAVDEFGEKGTVRDAGRLIEKEFATERENIKQLVEAHAASQTAETAETAARADRLARLPIFDVAGPDPGSAAGSGGGQSRARRAGGDGSSASSITATYNARSKFPPAQPAGRGRTLAVGALGVAVVAGGLFFAIRRPIAQSAATTLPAAPTAPSVRTIVVDSTPQGATVKEGDNVLGTTPLTVDVDLAAGGSRRLVMGLDGYQPHTFLITRDDARVQVPLAPLAASAPDPHATAAPPPRVVSPHVVKPMPSDINMKR